MKKIKVFDIITITILIFLSLYYFKLNNNEGKKKLYLLIDNKIEKLKFANYKLNLNKKYKKNIILEIKDDKARIIDSDCPNKICIKQGWISNCGESAVCLPNKTAIQIKCEGQNIDAISQ